MSLENCRARACIFCVITFAFFCAYAVTFLVVTPLQNALFGETQVWRSVVYLPHGVCVLATMLFGWRAIVPLTLGSTGGLFFFSADRLVEIGALSSGLAAIATAACAFVAFEVFRFFGRNHYATPAANVQWRSVFAVGILAALIGAFAKSNLLCAPGSCEGNMHDYWLSVSGSICGLFAVMYVLMHLFRRARLSGRDWA